MFQKRFLELPNLLNCELPFTKPYFHVESVDDLRSMDDIGPAIFKEAQINCKMGTFSSMTALCALSSVAGTQIQSLYSPSSTGKIFTLFTTYVKPRITRSSRKKITVLWSSTSKDYNKPNHFVLCKFSAPEISVKKSGKSKLTKRKCQSKLLFEPLKKKGNLSTTYAGSSTSILPSSTFVTTSASLQPSRSISSSACNSFFTPNTSVSSILSINKTSSSASFTSPVTSSSSKITIASISPISSAFPSNQSKIDFPHSSSIPVGFLSPQRPIRYSVQVHSAM